MTSFGEGRLRQSIHRLRTGRGSDPVLWADLLQIAKTALAGALAWWLATDVLGLDQPFLAPWSAVLVVHATVYRTFSQGAQQVAATFAGVFIAWGTGLVIGLGAVAMGVMLVLAYLVGRIRLMGAESTTVATTAIVVLATNAVSESNLLWGRLQDTLVGIAVGLLVNLLVWPPLRDRAVWASAARIPGELADLLARIAEELGPDFDPDDPEAWKLRAREVDVRIDETWGLLRSAQESGRFNPRKRTRTNRLPELVDALQRLEQAVADAQSMVRTITLSNHEGTAWAQEFRHRWSSLLSETAGAVRDLDEEGLDRVRAGLLQLSDDLVNGDLAEGIRGDGVWQEYGGLIINLRNVVDAVSYVVAPTPPEPWAPEQWWGVVRRLTRSPRGRGSS